jgi:hypothetical protein
MTRIVKQILKLLLPGGIFVLYNYLHIKINNYRKKEVKKNYGKLFPDKTFYIIRRDPHAKAGLFSNYHVVLANIIYAINNNYIPVVDMLNYRTNYNEKNPINGTQNAWEYYFQQPTEYNFDDVYKSKNVILSSMNSPEKHTDVYNPNSEKIVFYYSFISKYMKFRPDVIEIAEKKKEIIFMNKQNILGVFSRGSDYRNLCPPDHPIVPTLALLVEKTKQLFKEWNMSYIFLSSEEEYVVDEFRKIFGEIVIVNDRNRLFDYDINLTVSEIGYNRENDKYKRGLEYIIDIILLSQCDSLICPMVNGAVVARELNHNKYIHQYIFDLGTYHNTRMEFMY